MAKIGFDLDNTIIDYSDSVYKYSTIFLTENFHDISSLRKKFKDKAQFTWEHAQSWIYTEGLTYAKPSTNFIEIAREIIKRGHQIYIISHKTSKTSEKFGGNNLQKCANKWINDMILTSFEISDSNIYFEDSQINKIRRINYLNLDIFIDDLYEVIQVLEMHDLVSIHYSSQSCEAKNHFCISDFRQLEKYVN